jgi:ABC-type transporter Mla subunit MlaD
MALQDLTPQLRTRLSRMERAVGLFVIVAAALLAFGFIYYVYATAERKGWFKIKAHYFTFTEAATGLKEGDPVRLMGLDVGQITKIETMPGDDFERNIYVEFSLKDPYYDYLWTEGSRARVATVDFLGKRVLEVTKGTGGHPLYEFYPTKDVDVAQIRTLPEWGTWKIAQDVYDATQTNLLLEAESRLSNNIAAIERLGLKQVRLLDARPGQKKKAVTAVWNEKKDWYEPFFKTNMYWLRCDESPAVTERLENLITEVEKALPGILVLTNQLGEALTNTASMMSNLNLVAAGARPAVSNLAVATSSLNHPGALGEWLVPTNLSAQLEGTLSKAETTLGSAQGAFQSANSNLTILVENLGRSLDNLAGITSNLNQQVQTNTNILSSVSKAVVDTDDLVQGLKHHWLFRSAFKKKPPPPPPKKSQQKK